MKPGKMKHPAAALPDYIRVLDFLAKFLGQLNRIQVSTGGEDGFYLVMGLGRITLTKI